MISAEYGEYSDSYLYGGFCPQGEAEPYSKRPTLGFIKFNLYQMNDTLSGYGRADWYSLFLHEVLHIMGLSAWQLNYIKPGLLEY